MNLPTIPQPGPYYSQGWAAALYQALTQFFQMYTRGDHEVQGKLITGAGCRRKVTEITDATYTVRLDDDIVAVDRAGTVTLTLPASPGRGAAWEIWDVGNAGTHTITIAPESGSINGASSVTITANYGRLFVRHTGSTYLAG